eukprot:4999594-Heterocapsa_arctica.AAC.1
MTLSPPRPLTPTSRSSTTHTTTSSLPSTATSRSTARLATAWPTTPPRAVGCPSKQSCRHRWPPPTSASR